MNYQSIIFHLCYPYDLFASHFQTSAYVLIRWSDYLRVETFLFGACNNVHYKFRFIIGLNYTLYNFFSANSLLRTRSSLQYVIRRFTWETSYLFICGNKMPTRCNRGFYCRSYYLLNEFRAPLCPTSGAQEYYTRVGTLIVTTIYLQLIQNRYMFRSFTVLQCSHQHCVQPVASDVEVVGYL